MKAECRETVSGKLLETGNSAGLPLSLPGSLDLVSLGLGLPAPVLGYVNVVFPVSHQQDCLLGSHLI